MRFTIGLKVILASSIIMILATFTGLYSIITSSQSAKESAYIDNFFIPTTKHFSNIAMHSMMAMRQVLMNMENSDSASYASALANFKAQKAETAAVMALFENPDYSIRLPGMAQTLKDYDAVAVAYSTSAVNSMDLIKQTFDLYGKFGLRTADLLETTTRIYNISYTKLIDSNITNNEADRLRRLKINSECVSIFLIAGDVASKFALAIDKTNFEPIKDIEKQLDIINKNIKNIENSSVAAETRDLATKLRNTFDSSVPLIVEIKQLLNELQISANNRIQYATSLEEFNMKILEAASNGTLATSVEATKGLKKGEFGSLVSLIIIFIVGSVIIFMMTRTVVKPIRNFVTIVGELTSGDGDLTKRLKVDTNDELADLAKNFNKFIVNVQEIINEVKLSAEEVASGNNQLAATMEELSTTFDSQTKQISDIVSNMDAISNASQETAANLNNSLNTLKETTVLTQNGTKQLESVKESVLSINSQAKALSATIGRLSQSSSQIGDILTVINDIADQTNLLALNAAIEAARAGDAGRGFAVVADEVRKLAERTQKATSEIEVIISSLQRESEAASVEMKGAAETVINGVQNIEATSTGFAQVVLGVMDTNNDINKVTELVNNQARSIQNIGDNTQIVASGVEESNAAVNEVTVTVSHLQERTERLKSIVGRFKV